MFWCFKVAIGSIVAFVAMGSSPSLAQVTRYVDDNASSDPGPGNPLVSDPGENGTWDHPYDAIQEALNQSQNGDTVFVLDGTYRGSGNRDLTFPKTMGIARSVLVRSYNGASTTTIDCEGTALSPHRGFHFLDDEAPPEAIVQGFTITGGYGGGLHASGGAIEIVQSSPTIRDCVLKSNSAIQGGAIGFAKSSSSLIEGCVIESNTGVNMGGGGGAIYATALGVKPVIERCILRNNSTSGFGGGAAFVNGAQLTFVDTVIECNQSATFGGGIYGNDNAGGDSTWHSMKRCTIACNKSLTRDGGGIYLNVASAADQSTRVTLAACTVAGNEAVDPSFGSGGGVAILGGSNEIVQIVDSLIAHNRSTRRSAAIWLDWNLRADLDNNTIVANTTTLISSTHGNALCWTNALDSQDSYFDNSIAWLAMNTNPQIYVDEDAANRNLFVRYSAIQGGYSGAQQSPISDTPQFISPNGADGVATTWADNVYRLKSGSPGIDRGNNTFANLDIADLDGDNDVTERIPFDREGAPRFADDPLTSNAGVADPPLYPQVVDIGAFEYGVPSTPSVAPYPHDRTKNRYISFTPNNGTKGVAFRVTKLNSGVLGGPGGTCWAGPPNPMGISQCLSYPTFRSWSESVIHVGDCEIVPVANYEVDATSDGVIFSATRLGVSTILQPTLSGDYWGDICGANDGTEFVPPNQITNVIDIMGVLFNINGYPIRPHFTVANLQSTSANDSCLDYYVNTADLLAVQLAMQSGYYGLPLGSKIIDPNMCPVCPLPPESPGPSCCGGSQQEESGEALDITDVTNGAELVPRLASGQARSDQWIEVEVFGIHISHLNAYEIALELFDGAGETIAPARIEIDNRRSDFIFKNRQFYSIDNLEAGFAGVVLASGDAMTADFEGYLATFVFKLPLNAQGDFRAVVNGQRTFLLDEGGNELAINKSSDVIFRTGERQLFEELREKK